MPAGHCGSLWSKVSALECVDRFRREGMTVRATDMRFRSTILERGTVRMDASWSVEMCFAHGGPGGPPVFAAASPPDPAVDPSSERHASACGQGARSPAFRNPGSPVEDGGETVQK